MKDLSGQQLKGYLLHECIGVGGFGAVYRAYQPSIQREVAIKIILPGVAYHPDFVRRFEMEAQLVARLEHMNIVPLYDYWRDKDGAYLVMRWLRGGSLRDKLAKGACTLEETGRIVNQLTSALTTAHRNNVIHRDLKPANIVLDEQGNAYLSDFGIAKDNNSRDGSLTDADAVVGSLDYISPEQARSEPVTPRTDIYGLGVVVYEMLVGEHPFPNAKSVERLYKHLNERLPKIMNLPIQIANGVNEVIQKATAKDPLQRYSNATEFATAFMEAAQLASSPIGTNIVELLTLREREVLQLMLNNCSNKEIADQLIVSVNTVKYFQKQIYSKLRVRNRVQAIIRARGLDLVFGIADDGKTSAGTPITSQLPEPNNPYKGLQAFQSADNLQFFGRERLTEKIIQRLDENESWSRFLAVIGPSGSGKSSVVKAGVIPALWRGEIQGSDHWFIAEMTPGSHPLEELEIALSQVSTSATANIMQQLERDDRGLLRAVRMILPEDSSELVLVIDQFEEVFTLVGDEAQRTYFLKLLFNAVSDPRSRIRILITLRADFYDRPLRYVDFGEMLRTRMETVLPLSAEELERAIVTPARNEGVQFEEGLAAAIISEVNYQPGALPLLQYALTELFERREQRLLTHQGYATIGGTVGALAKRADELYMELDSAGQTIVRQTFMRLVTLGEGTEDTRRRVYHSELIAVCSNADLLEEIIDTFVAYRLLSLDHDPITRNPTVEIAHEAILSVWRRLQAWINDNREEIKMQQQLTRMAEEWQQAQFDPSYLVKGGLRLEQMAAWAQETELALSQLERQFLEASIAEYKQRKELDQAQKEHVATVERRSIQRLRLVVVVLIVATFMSILLTGVALTQRNEAQRNAVLVQRQANENRNLYLTNEAQDAARQGDNFLAAALLVEAIRIDSSSEQSNRLLNEMMPQSAPIRHLVGHNDDVTAVAFSPDGMTAVSGSSDNTLILWDIATGAIVRRFEGHTARITDVAFSPDGASIVSASGDNTLILWNRVTGEVMRRFEGHDDVVQAVTISPDGQLLLSSACARKDRNTNCISSELILWDVQSGNILATSEAHDDVVFAVAFMPEELQALSISNNSVILWQVANNSLNEQKPMFDTFRGFRYADYNPLDRSIYAILANQSVVRQSLTESVVQTLLDGEERITIATLSPDYRKVATIEDDTFTLINLATGTQEQYGGLTDRVTTFIFSPDGRMMLSGSGDGTLLLWDLEPTVLRQFEGHQGSTMGLAISPDGRMVLGGGGILSSVEDYDLILWDAETGEIIRRLDENTTAVPDVAISPDGRLAVSAAFDTSVVGVWDLASGELINRFEGLPSRHVAFSPNGQTVISSEKFARPVLWDVATGEVLRTFTEDAPSIGNPPDVGAENFLNPVTISADGKFVASAITNTLLTWDIETGDEVLRVAGLGNVYDVAFSPNGQLIATASTAQGISVLETDTGQIVYSFPVYDVDHERGRQAFGVAFSPDSEWLLSGWGSNAVVLWNMSSGNPLALGYHDDAVWHVAFTPDGIPVSSSFDGTVRMWKMPDTNLLDWVAANRYIRDFTCAERAEYRIEPLCTDEN